MATRSLPSRLVHNKLQGPITEGRPPQQKTGAHNTRQAPTTEDRRPQQKTGAHNRRPHSRTGRIGKVVASHAAVARSSPAEVALIYTMHEALRGYCP